MAFPASTATRDCQNLRFLNRSTAGRPASPCVRIQHFRLDILSGNSAYSQSPPLVCFFCTELDPAGSHSARGSHPKCILGFNTVFRGPRSVQPARTRSMVWSGLTLPRLRRLSQILFLGLFLVLLCKTEFRGSFQPGEL